MWTRNDEQEKYTMTCSLTEKEGTDEHELDPGLGMKQPQQHKPTTVS